MIGAVRENRYSAHPSAAVVHTRLRLLTESQGMAARTSHSPPAPFEQNPADWTDQQIDEHPLVVLGWDEIPPDQVEEARLVQLEQLRRFHLRGTLPLYTPIMEDPPSLPVDSEPP